MPIALADKVCGVLTGLTREHVELLPPAERRRLADQCRRVIDLTEPKAEPKNGVLRELKLRGARAET